jgi:hypothetical protein
MHFGEQWHVVKISILGQFYKNLQKWSLMQYILCAAIGLIFAILVILVRGLDAGAELVLRGGHLQYLARSILESPK